MTTTTTNVEKVKLNIMTSSQYNTATKNANELYMVTDATMNYNDLSNKPDLSIYAQDADVVHKTGDETITGNKTFNSNVVLKNNTSSTTAPSADKSRFLNFYDNNDVLNGAVQSKIYTDLTIEAILFASSMTTGTRRDSALRCVLPASGNAYVGAPASDVGGSVVTTVSKSKSSNGYFKLGNGLIVQWGSLNGETNTSGTINFPTAFSSTYFRVVAVSNKQGVSVSISQESTTGCTWTKNNTSAYIKWIAIGY